MRALRVLSVLAGLAIGIYGLLLFGAPVFAPDATRNFVDIIEGLSWLCGATLLLGLGLSRQNALPAYARN